MTDTIVTFRLIHAVVIASLIPAAALAQGLHGILPDENVDAFIQKQKQHFARVGTAKGSGYKQFKRWEQFVAPRVYPSGEPINIAALTWLNHYNASRSADFSARSSRALASGIGNGNWRSIGPMRYVRGQYGYNGGIGRINAIAFHPTEPATIYAGTPSAGCGDRRTAAIAGAR